jgi:Mce-associated membrane protein
VVGSALVVSLLAGLLAIAGGVEWVHSRHHGSSAGGTDSVNSAQATTAMAEGGQLAVDFTSFNYQTFSQDLAATSKHATPAFAKVYLAQSRAIAPAIKKVKAVANSQVDATGLQSYSAAKGTASVIVALDESTKNVKTPAGTVVYLRMQVKMVRQHGQWLATGVEPQ